jgi:hypothetical protein
MAGRKVVEVRTWSTNRRGSILIHAAKLPDRRPEAWALVAGDRNLRAATEVRGGVVGVSELTDCLTYATARAFAADRGRHLNEPAWYRPPRMYGFVLAEARPVAFVPCIGYTFFFTVHGVVLSGA